MISDTISIWWIFFIFTDGFPQIYLNTCCFGPRIQIEINGEFITKVTHYNTYLVSQDIHHDDRCNIGEDVMRKIDVLELMIYESHYHKSWYGNELNQPSHILFYQIYKKRLLSALSKFWNCLFLFHLLYNLLCHSFYSLYPLW